jgi:uncharacterized protein (DUF2235 family)
MRRRIVVCADGTWNTADESSGGVRTPTNVIKLARSISPAAGDGSPQFIYYHEGVGTHPGLERMLGGAFGEGIDRNVCDCYRYLIHNYEDGDEIFLFGFSRGAYTVRSLAGLIRNSGLLSPEHENRIPDAYELYRDRNDGSAPNAPRSKAFRTEFSRAVRIKCLGVWDTVGALGIPIEGLNFLDRHRYEFHDVRLSSWIDNAFQALAIDEQRGPFLPAVWEQQANPQQRLEQVWFAGVHANVGGGYRDSGLSDIALRWMIERAQECGLEFRQTFVDHLTRPAFDGQLRDSMTPLYHLFLPRVRQIARPRFDEGGNSINTGESVHPTALQRYVTIVAPPQGPYRPANLTAYLERHPQAATVTVG